MFNTPIDAVVLVQCSLLLFRYHHYAHFWCKSGVQVIIPTRTIPTSTTPTLTIPTRTCVTDPKPNTNPTCAHVDLGAGLLQYADNRPTIITLVGTVAVGMVSVRMVGVGMVPAPRKSASQSVLHLTVYII